MNKKKLYILIISAVIILLLFLVTKLFYQEGDGWVRDSDGLWIVHGDPQVIPDEVKNQYDAILCGLVLYSQEKAKNASLNSECLGICKNYAIDMVNVPRNADDDKEENQCEEFLNGNVEKLIEIDKDAEIVRIID